MFYLLIAFFLVQSISFYLMERNKKKLSPEDLKLLKKITFQDHQVLFIFLGSMIFIGFKFNGLISWITPYPIAFLMTILFAWAFVIRLIINQSNLPKDFVKKDNILTAVQIVALLPLLFILFSFDF